MLPLSTAYIEAKNKLSDDYPWISLLQITFIGETLRICANTQDIEWNGHTWVAFPFEIDMIKDATKTETPMTVVKVGNPNRAIQYYVESYGGGIGASIAIMVVYLGDLAEVTNIPMFEFKVTGCRCNAEWAMFSIGTTSPSMKRDPRDRILKNFCRYDFPNSKDARCPYAGSTYTSCNKTLSDCRVRNGSGSRFFGGYPGVGSYAIYV